MKSPEEFYCNDRPYDSYEEYLSELFVWMNLKLQKYLNDNRDYYEQEYNRNGAAGFSWQGILQVLEGRLKREGLKSKQSLELWEERIRDRLEMSELTESFFAIEYIVSKFAMDEMGKVILLLSLMAFLDSTYREVFCYLNKNAEKSFPTLELCGKICQKQGQTQFDIYHQIYQRIRDYRILFPKINKADECITQELVCDERFLDVLLGKNRCVPQGVDILETGDEEPLFFREKELQELESFSEDKNFPIFLLCGEKGIGKKHLIRHYANQHQMSVVLFDACSYERMGEAGFEKMTEALQYAVRECILWTMPLVIQGIDGFDHNLVERLLIQLKEELLEIVQLIFVLVKDENYMSETNGIYRLPLQEFNEVQRLQFWETYQEKYSLDTDVSLEEVANTFSLTPGQIKGALYQAAVSSGGLKKTINKKMLYQACYGQLHHKMGKATEKVKVGFMWEDLKMEAQDKQILRDICNCVKNKHTVMTKWNFAKIVPYGAGITVLFAGPPGTGKTMAAQVIANELQMELYKIDLSQLMDKYIGETEKNIKSVFEQAQKSNSVLFFDEADAIFGKRLEASNANERFANIESSLLLQCIESYKGISILATNNFHSIDAAFIRRFKYYILFREPDEATRYEIWRSVFPKEAPLEEDVDFYLLAHLFDFTGAIIKNVALAAAYLAAEKEKPISNVDILKAVRREMQKINLVLTKEKLGNLGYLFEEIIDK